MEAVSKCPKPTDGEQEILDTLELFPKMCSSEVIRFLNISPKNHCLMLDRMAYVGLLEPIQGKSFGHEYVHKLDQVMYNEFRTILMLEYLEEKGMVETDIKLGLGVRYLLRDKAAELNLKTPTTNDMIFCIFYLKKIHKIEMIVSLQEFLIGIQTYQKERFKNEKL